MERSVAQEWVERWRDGAVGERVEMEPSERNGERAGGRRSKRQREMENAIVAWRETRDRVETVIFFPFFFQLARSIF